MEYRPQNLDAVALLKRAKFIRNPRGAGFVRTEMNKNRKSAPDEHTLIRRRYHAFIRDGLIDFHYDMPKGKKQHKSASRTYGRGGSRIRKMLVEFGMLDYQRPSKPLTPTLLTT